MRNNMKTFQNACKLAVPNKLYLFFICLKQFGYLKKYFPKYFVTSETQRQTWRNEKSIDKKFTLGTFFSICLAVLLRN